MNSTVWKYCHSFEWSHCRVLSTDSKVRSALAYKTLSFILLVNRLRGPDSLKLCCLELQKNGLPKMCDLFSVVTLLQNKLKSDVAHFTTHVRTCLEQRIRLQGLFSWVIKRTTSLFDSFYSKVAKQVAHFLLPILPHLNYQCAWCPVHVHVYLTYFVGHVCRLVCKNMTS